MVRCAHRFWQFSLRDALLGLLIGCLIATYWGERQLHLLESRRRVDAERRGSLLLNEKAASEGAVKAQGKVKITNPAKVHVKAVEASIGSREGDGWTWQLYLPPEREWWLYISQGEHWSEEEGKYLSGAVSGSRMRDGSESLISGCISCDLEGGAYVRIWVGSASHAAQLPDDGYAVFRASSKETRVLAGEQE